MLSYQVHENSLCGDIQDWQSKGAKPLLLIVSQPAKTAVSAKLASSLLLVGTMSAYQTVTGGMTSKSLFEAKLKAKGIQFETLPSCVRGKFN